MMMEARKTFQEQCAVMKLETFNPAAFVEDGKVSQELCNFMLALALIYNDFKNLMYAGFKLRESKPTGTPEPTAVWGTYSGMDTHIYRLLIGLLHELFELI